MERPAQDGRALGLDGSQEYFGGRLVTNVDATELTGIEQIVDAVEHLHARKNRGKVVVKLA